MTVQIVTSAAAPATPVLQAASDTGALGDNTTSVRNPQFNVSGVPAGATLSLLRDGVVVSTVLSPGGGTVAIGDPGPLLDGQYTYTASLVDGAGNQSPPSGSLTVSIVTVKGDYTGAGFADLAVFDRVSPSELDTFIAGGITPPGGSNGLRLGHPRYPVPGRPRRRRQDRPDPLPAEHEPVVRAGVVGWVSSSSPSVPPATSRPWATSTGSATTSWRSTGRAPASGSSRGMASVFATFGGPGDIPVAAAELLRHRPGRAGGVPSEHGDSGSWRGRRAGSTSAGQGTSRSRCSTTTARAATCWRCSVRARASGSWRVRGAGSASAESGDVPIAADFDGIGHDEIGVYRPSTGQWFVGGSCDARSRPSAARPTFRWKRRTCTGWRASVRRAFPRPRSTRSTSAPMRRRCRRGREPPPQP